GSGDRREAPDRARDHPGPKDGREVPRGAADPAGETAEAGFDPLRCVPFRRWRAERGLDLLERARVDVIAERGPADPREILPAQRVAERVLAPSDLRRELGRGEPVAVGGFRLLAGVGL